MPTVPNACYICVLLLIAAAGPTEESSHFSHRTNKNGQNSHLQTAYTAVAETSSGRTVISVQGERLAVVSVRQKKLLHQASCHYHELSFI